MASRADPQARRGRRQEAERQARRPSGSTGRRRGGGPALTPLVSERARAKVNLFLHVLGKRDDGYHVLDSLAVFPDVADVVQAEPGDTLTLRLEGPFAGALDGDNLVMRAAQALQRASGTRQGASLALQKNLPVASGIGGGSADAAAALRALDRLWQTRMPTEAMAEIALGLGADVPVCLRSEPARMGGVGERLGAAPALPACGMVLINPRVPVATADVFRTRERHYSEAATLPQAWHDPAQMAADLEHLSNDLEAAALRLCPPIADVLAWLRHQPGCLLARMSGSGSTCFALFTTPPAAATTAQRANPAWWHWGGPLA